VLSRTSDILAVNPEGLALFHGMAEWPAERRNTIRYFYLHPAARELYADWDRPAVHTAAHLRALEADHPGDPALRALIAEPQAGNPEFARLWQQHEVRHRCGERKPFRHPRVAEFTLTTERSALGRWCGSQGEPEVRHDEPRRRAQLAAQSSRRATGMTRVVRMASM
jgi:hypothetical protein